MLLSTSNPTPSPQVMVKKSGENLYNNSAIITNNASNTTSIINREDLVPLSAFSLQPLTSNSINNLAKATTEAFTPNYHHETKASSDSTPTRLQPPTTTNFPIITSSNPSVRTTPGHPTFHSSFPIMTNNFLAPSLFSSTVHHTTSTLPNSSTSPSPSFIPSIGITKSESLPKPVPTASSILAPSLSLIETESISPQPVRISTILSSFSNSSDPYHTEATTAAAGSSTMDTTPKVVRVRKLTPKSKISTEYGKHGEPTTPNKESPRNEPESPNPFNTLYSKPLSSFPLHPSTANANTFSPFPPPATNSQSRLVSPSTTPTPISLWPSSGNKQVVGPPANISPPSTKKRKVNANSQDSIGASLQPLTPLTPPTPLTPSHQFSFPSVRLPPTPSPSTYIPPPFPISSASLNPVKVGSIEKKATPDVPSLDISLARSKKKENMVSCNSIRIPFKSWMKTLETLSAPNLKAVQERIFQLLEKKEEERKKNQPKQETLVQTPSNNNKLNCSNETLSLLSTDLSSIDTLAILALADSPPSPAMEGNKSSELISESVELFPSKSPEKPNIESDNSEEEYSEDETNLSLKTARVEPFVREYTGNGFIYPGRRGAKSQRMRLPLCFFPSMKLVLVADSGPETFIEGDEIVNPVIDLEHHLEFFIPDSEKQLYKSIKGLHLILLKRIGKNYYVEESSILVQRSARSEDGGYNFSLVNQPPTPSLEGVQTEKHSDYSLLLIETRGKRRSVQEVDKVNRYCEINHELGTNQCKIRVGFRICKAQKKKHTKGIYLLRLVACLSENDEITFDSSNKPTNGVTKVLEESEMFKIVSRRATVERTRINRTTPPNNLKRKNDEDETNQADSYSE